MTKFPVCQACHDPVWCSINRACYPKKQEAPPTRQRKHAALIKAWADGAEIEHLRSNGTWGPCKPLWMENDNYRIKPTPGRVISKNEALGALEAMEDYNAGENGFICCQGTVRQYIEQQENNVSTKGET